MNFMIGKEKVLVDKSDIPRLKKFTWRTRKTNNGLVYAETCLVGKNSNLLMHRYIMGIKPGFIADHINRNTLDNRKKNLRFCTRSQNMANSKRKSIIGKSSQYKGVSFWARNQKWMARIRVNYVLINLGVYDNEKDAAMAYDRKALEVWGEFAWTNFTKAEIEAHPFKQRRRYKKANGSLPS